MKEGEWLSILLFDTGLINNSSLSEKEIFSIKSHIQEGKSLSEISQELGVTNERIRQIIENGFGKILLTVKTLLAKSVWLEKILAEKEDLEKELSKLKTNLQNDPVNDQKMTIELDKCNIPISDLPFSVRAKKALAKLNINSVNQLDQLDLQKLKILSQVGIKTINEIINRAKEMGIKIS